MKTQAQVLANVNVEAGKANYAASLENGLVMLRSMFYNANKEKIILQFMEHIDRAQTGGTSLPAAIALFHEVSTFRKVTNLAPVPVPVAKRLLGDEIIDAVIAKGGNVGADRIVNVEALNISAVDLLAKLDAKITTAHIQVTETTTVDPNYPNQQQKEDGEGNALTYEGYPIYVNTVLVLNADPKHTFLQHDKAEAVPTNINPSALEGLFDIK